MRISELERVRHGAQVFRGSAVDGNLVLRPSGFFVKCQITDIGYICAAPIIIFDSKNARKAG